MHILTYTATAPAEEKATSEILADSVQVNPGDQYLQYIVIAVKEKQILITGQMARWRKWSLPFDYNWLFDVYRSRFRIKR